MKQIDKDKIVEAVRKEFGYDESINLSPLAENIGLAFNENIEEAVKEAIRLTKQEALDLIEKEIDNGNVEGGGFSPALCLNKVMKWLGGDEEI